ncbi:MAG: flagellar biosynthetic protein FliR [Pseudomonadota bacterium]
MSAIFSDAVLLLFVAFSRIGGCFLVLPGISGSRVPTQVRLLLVLAITIAMLPQIWPLLGTATIDQPSLLARLIIAETIVGLMIGLSVRFFLLALGFMATAMGTVIGYGNLMGPGFEETEPQAAIGTLLTMAALLILFMLDFHHAVIRALIKSYDHMPVGGPMFEDFYLQHLVSTLQESFMLVLRLGSPFIAYSLIMNLMIGVLNKLTPQIPIYFISLPFIIVGGLILLYFSAPVFLTLFAEGFFDTRVLR